jgi:hypothetical protein
MAEVQAIESESATMKFPNPFPSLRGTIMKRKPKTTKPGTVKKVIKHPDPREPEKAEIAVEGADHLYREIRIENRLEDLKQGAHVDVTVEAEDKDTTPENKSHA